MAHDEQWLTPRLQTAATLCNQTPAATESPLWLGVDLGTCDVVSMVVDRDGQPVAVCLDWADVVRDGIVWDFFGAVTIVRRHLDTLEQQFGRRFSHAATSFPPGTDPRISINVLESAGLEVSHVLDEPTADRGSAATGQRRCSGYRRRHYRHCHREKGQSDVLGG